MARVLVVDDEKKIITLLTSALRARGHDVVGSDKGRDALDVAAGQHFDVVLTDLKMEPVDGLAVLRGIRAADPDTQVIILTAHGNVDSAVRAMQDGAYHYLTKPFNFQEVAQVVEMAAEAGRLARENRALRRVLAATEPSRKFIGLAPATKKLRHMIAQVAPSDATVLIRGQSGVGKEVAARAIHAASGRAKGPFIAVNCAAISETLLESELFGYRKGAFTGADEDREGMFEAACGGTIFLDEIGEAGPAVQAKLLRVLEEKKINRVGDPRERSVDVRILAATNRPLEQAIAAGTFREDLYYRLLVFPLDVPPLCERLEDLPLLTEHFLVGLGRKGVRLDAATMARLRAHSWPGNVRELRNLLERAHILAGSGEITAEHIVLDVAGPAVGGAVPADAGNDLNLDDNARRLIRTALCRTGGNKSEAAALLGITRRTLYSRLKLLGMEQEDIPGR